MSKRNNHSKKTAWSVLQALISKSDLRDLEYKRAVILAGLPGSGKSTVAQLLITNYDFERHSTDQIRMQELYRGQAHRVASQHERVMASRYLVYEELGRRVIKALAGGKRVVVDGTNLDDKRMGVLGSILSQIPVEQVAIIVIKPPEWIMRRRFEEVSLKQKEDWWSVYRYWRSYMKQGKASFPSESVFPRVQIMRLKRYALKTFDWVPEIKGILWDLDGTLYKDHPEHREAFDKPCIEEYIRVTGLSRSEGEKKFWSEYKRLASKTKTLESIGVDGQAFIRKVAMILPYEKYYKKDKRLRRMIESLDQVRHFVFTNAGEEETELKLKVLGLDGGLFEKVIAGYGARYTKPDPRAFAWAARQCGMKPGEILAVGDREATDMIPAGKAGFKTCFVWGVSREADVSLPTVYEVAELFGVEG